MSDCAEKCFRDEAKELENIQEEIKRTLSNFNLPIV